MSKLNIFKGIRNLRLTLADDDTKTELWSAKADRRKTLVLLITVLTVGFAASFAIIAFTPLRNLIPGYPDSHTRRAAIENALRLDSLENEMIKWELYSENLSRVVTGREPLGIDSLLRARRMYEEGIQTDSGAAQPSKEEMARKDSLLRQEVIGESRFEIHASSSRVLPIEGMHFFTPVKGVVSQGYDKALHPYVDITAPGNSVVKAVLDGTVISAGWDDNDGYTIRIQHEGDIISVYKHNEKLMKKTGDKVTAGTPIAVVGNSGRLSDGIHLHFELWHKGEAVDPAKYISF